MRPPHYHYIELAINSPSILQSFDALPEALFFKIPAHVNRKATAHQAPLATFHVLATLGNKQGVSADDVGLAVDTYHAVCRIYGKICDWAEKCAEEELRFIEKGATVDQARLCVYQQKGVRPLSPKERASIAHTSRRLGLALTAECV